MEKTLERGDARIQKICDALREETLEPAKNEAKQLIENAKHQAAEIVKESEKHAAKILEEAHKKMEQERKVFQSSLEQAGKQGLEELRQNIESKLFEPCLEETMSRELAKPKLIADLITAMVEAIQKEGVSADFSAVISNGASPQEINALLGKKILEKLREGSVVIGNGVQLKLHDKKMTLDVTEDALRELFSRYLRKDFRKLFFGC